MSAYWEKEYYIPSECMQCEHHRTDYCPIPDEMITYCTKTGELRRVWQYMPLPCETDKKFERLEKIHF